MRIRILFLLPVISIQSHAQLKIRNCNLGYRMFEVDAVGNNPTTIAFLLKEPVSYQQFLDSIQYNSLWGGGGVQILRNYYLNAEWQKDPKQYPFWRHYSIQTGVLISNRLRKDNMAVANQYTEFTSSDTTLHSDKYTVGQELQFLGVNVGLNRRFKISGRFQFLTGLHAQGSIAIVHSYHQQWDSLIFSRQQRINKTIQLPDLKGKNFLQWQVMIPLAIEANLYKNSILLRLEVDAGIIRDHYRSYKSNRESHGAGFWIIYIPKRKLRA